MGQNNITIGLGGPGTKNECTGEDQKQFFRSQNRKCIIDLNVWIKAIMA
jgi:hypothetical protein